MKMIIEVLLDEDQLTDQRITLEEVQQAARDAVLGAMYQLRGEARRGNAPSSIDYEVSTFIENNG
jgi:hypothetical protein